MKIGLGIGIPFIRNYVSSIVFDPSKLFTGNTNGAWYDPSDTTTLYRDAAGTQPVTAVEQPVGLMLDKSKGLVLGPEMFTGQTPTLIFTGTARASYDTATRTFTCTTSGTAQVRGSFYIGMTVGKRYRIKATLTGEFSNVYFSIVTGASTIIPSTSGVIDCNIVASAATIEILNPGGLTAGGALQVNSLSVQEIPGNHAFNSSGNSANFPVLSARVNLLTKSEDFSDAVWANNTLVTANTHTSPNGTLSADTFTSNGTANNISQSMASFSGVQYKLSVSLKYTNNRWVLLQLSDVGSTHRVRAWFDVLNGVKGTSAVTGSGIVVDYTITPEGNGWYRCTLIATNPITILYAYFPSLVTADGVITVAANGQSVAVWGADLRVANDALNQPAYQRVNTATDYDTVGFKPYLRFNGTNQWLQTNSIDFTYGDKMFVSAGVRKLSDSTQVVAELSSDINPNSGTFILPVLGANYAFASRGTVFSGSNYAISGNTYTAPTTNTISGVGSISGDSSVARINGSQVAISTTDQGTGNYGNYPLYIGARAGTSLWFNGRLYSLIVAGKLVNAVEITETEKYVNGKTAAY